MHRWIVALLLLGLGLVPAVAPVPVAFATKAELSRRPYTVDDMLRIEGIGEAWIEPTGKTLIMEYLPPYEERGLYGIDRGGEILQLNLAEKPSVARLFEHQPDKKYWLGNASPNGRRLIIFEASRKEVRIGVFDFNTGRLHLIDEIPQVNERFELNDPVWVSEHEIILSSRSKDWDQYGIRERRLATDQISALREEAFIGRYSGVSVSTNPDERWLDGVLIKYDVSNERATILADGRFGSFRVTNDGKKLAALRLGQRLMHFRVSRLSDFYRFDTQLFIFDLEHHASRSFLPNAHIAMGSLRWSSTGSRLSFFAWNVKENMDQGSHYVLESQIPVPVKVKNFVTSWMEVGGSRSLRSPVPAEWLREQLIVHGRMTTKFNQIGDLDSASVAPQSGEMGAWHEISLETMMAESTAKESTQSRQVRYLQDGRLLLNSERAVTLVSDSEAPQRLRLDNGHAIRILNGTQRDPIQSILVYSTETEGGNMLGFFDIEKSELVVPPTMISGQILALADNAQQFVIRSDSEKGGALHLASQDGFSRKIFSFNQHLSTVEHPRWRTINYRGHDGADTYSCVILPYDYDARKSYPTIVDIYPGTGKGCRGDLDMRPQPLGHSSPFHNSNEVLSANGYLILVPSNNYHASYFNGLLYGRLADQVDAALDALIDSGMSDPNRIGLWGFSNGSMAGLWLSSVSARYKGTIAMFGASSPYIEYYGGTSSPALHLYLGTPIVHLVQYEAPAGTMPLSMGRGAGADPIGYIKASPLDRVRSICNPVMMVHSDLDSFTPFHYEALFAAMYRQGKQADLIRYYGEGHGLRSPDNIRDFYARVLLFFNEHVINGVPEVRCEGNGA